MKKSVVSIISFLCMLALMISGCTPQTPQPSEQVYYTVTFDSRGGSEVESQRILSGNPVRRPETPLYGGYDFIGWFTDENAAEETRWNFDTGRVNSDMTLYAGWLTVQAQEPTASLVYEREGDSYIVTDVGDETAIVIPAEYDGLPVTAIRGDYGTGAFARKDIVSVSIPDSIVEIGQNTFSGCDSLTTVRISENSNLTLIGNNAFSGCSALACIYLPQSVTSLGDNVFNNCGALEEIEVAAGNAAYRSENGHLIERATNTLLRGGSNGEVPEGVVTISQAAFRRSAVTSVIIPSTVSEIGNYVFEDCTALEEIVVSEQNSDYASLDGILYNKSLTTLIKTPEGIGGNISLPATLTEIPMYAFDGLDGITSLYIPYGALSNIRFGAFRDTSMTISYGGTQSQWEAVQKHAQWGGADLTVNFEVSEPSDTAEILVVYFSCTGNTERIAQEIARQTGGVLWEVVAADPYTSADLNYSNSDCRANREQNDPNSRPEISGTVDDFSEFDTVMLGYPIWWGDAPRIIQTFIESYSFEDKTVYTFSTSGSSSGSGAYNFLVSEYENIGFVGYFHSTSSQLSSAQTRVSSWLDEIGLFASSQSAEGVRMQMTVGGEEIFVTLTDNSATRDLVNRLKQGAITLSFSDFGGSEKIAYFDEKLDTSDAEGYDPTVGDLTIYTPWGNLAAFYRDTSAFSSSLVLVGKIEGNGIEVLSAQSGTFTVILELL